MSILETIVKQKRYFDVSSKKDIEMYRGFLTNHTWGHDGCPFVLEYPYLTIPDMIKDKLIHKFLKVEKFVWPKY
jgi:hypothetical protein